MTAARTLLVPLSVGAACCILVVGASAVAFRTEATASRLDRPPPHGWMGGLVARLVPIVAPAPAQSLATESVPASAWIGPLRHGRLGLLLDDARAHGIASYAVVCTAPPLPEPPGEVAWSEASELLVEDFDLCRVGDAAGLAGLPACSSHPAGAVFVRLLGADAAARPSAWKEHCRERYLVAAREG